MTLLFLGLYLAFIAGITIFLRKDRYSKEAYLVGDRRIRPWSMALSIASTWIWAPALFVSAEQAYASGVPGVFWFIVPNVLCLIIFIPIAKRVRGQMPNGFTLSGFMGERYSRRVKNVYLFQLSALSLFSTAVQLLAGGKILSLMTGLPFWLMTILLSLFTYGYSRKYGIRASVLTEGAQMVIMLLACLILVPFAIHLNGVSVLKNGLGGISGNYRHLFDAHGIEVMLTFGIPTAIGLIAGPFGDQNFWQRVFSIRQKHIGVTFGVGAVLFAIVPLAMSGLGFIAAGSGMIPVDQSVVNLELVTAIFPEWAAWVFMYMLLSGLLSTLNSNLCSISSLVTDMREKSDIKDLQVSMLVLALVATAIANIPGLTIMHLFLFYGVLRASTFIPVVLTAFKVRLTEPGVFYGVLASLVVGFPVFAYGNLFDSSAAILAGSIMTMLLSGLIAVIMSKAGGWRRAG